MLEQAILNSMVWCKTVLHAHGIASEIRKHHWTTDGVTPPFYGNLVTCTRDDAAQLARIEELRAMRPKPNWGMKDSFARLDVRDMKLLFEAHWFSGRVTPSDEYLCIETSVQLERWEHAWQITSPAPGERIFPVSLMDDPHVTFVAAVEGGTILGGAIANVSGDVVGISNEFGRDCKGAVQHLHPDRTIVGYDREVPEGFHDLGPLRVWVAS